METDILKSKQKDPSSSIKNEDIQLLQEITNTINGFKLRNGKKLTKDNIRSKFFNIYMKYLKLFFGVIGDDNKIRRDLNKINRESNKGEKFNNFYKHCNENRNFLEGILSKSKTGLNKKYSSYNNLHIFDLFESDIVRESISLFIEFIKAENNPFNLCEIFKIVCCSRDSLEHPSSCNEKWEKLMVYFQDLIYIEACSKLKREPVIEDYFCSSIK